MKTYLALLGGYNQKILRNVYVIINISSFTLTHRKRKNSFDCEFVFILFSTSSFSTEQFSS